MQLETRDLRSLPDAELEDSIREHLRSATFKPLAPEVFADLFDQWEGGHGQALYLRNLAHFDEADTDAFEPLLPSIPVPVLILWGQEDAWLPVATSERIAASIPHARRVVLPEAGHFSMEDQPDAVVQHLNAFLARDPAAEPSKCLETREGYRAGHRHGQSQRQGTGFPTVLSPEPGSAVIRHTRPT